MNEDANVWNNFLKEKLQLREQERWWKKVNETPKLRTYRLVKTKLAFEDYLKYQIKNSKRILITLQ